MKCVDNDMIDNVQVRGNLSLKNKNKNKYYDNKTSELIKKIDSSRNMKEYFQDKYGENGI